jgi:hypothetical protein
MVTPHVDEAEEGDEEEEDSGAVQTISSMKTVHENR